jgi:hypothetical protein
MQVSRLTGTVARAAIVSRDSARPIAAKREVEDDVVGAQVRVDVAVRVREERLRSAPGGSVEH